MYQISENGVDFIKGCEGLALCLYQCSAGKWTIGYGHTGADTSAQGYFDGATYCKIITVDMANSLLRRDLQRFEQAVNALCHGVELKQHQYDMLVSICFNIGTGERGFAGSTLLKRVKRDPNDILIQGEFLKWINAGGKFNKGLYARRMKEQNVYYKGYEK